MAYARVGPSGMLDPVAPMLHIRKSQLEAFEDEVRPALVEEAAARLRLRYGPYCAALGPEAVRATVELGMRRAEARGVDEHGVDVFIELMILLGSGFDRDPLLPWAAELLVDAEPGELSERLLQLYGVAMRLLDETAGHEARSLRAALARLAAHPWPRWSVPAGLGVDEAIVDTLRTLYPDKLRALEHRGLVPTLLRGGRATAARHELSGDWDIMLIVVLQFMLGTHFDDDPQLPWARNALLPGGPRVDTRAQVLLGEAQAFLQRVLAAISSRAGG